MPNVIARLVPEAGSAAPPWPCPPDFFAAAGADLISVLVEAMRQAGGPDDKAAVAKALINLKDFVALQGIVNFTPEATSEGVKGQMVEFQVKGGQFVLVNTVN